MKNVTPEEVKAAALVAGITTVDHHDCGGCGVWVKYLIHEEQLYFDSNCGCSSYKTVPRPCDWDEAAEWINMQSNPESRVSIAKQFGLDLELATSE